MKLSQCTSTSVTPVVGPRSGLDKAMEGRKGNSFRIMIDKMDEYQAWTPEIAADMAAAKEGPSSTLYIRRGDVLRKHYDRQLLIFEGNKQDGPTKKEGAAPMGGRLAWLRAREKAQKKDAKDVGALLGSNKDDGNATGFVRKYWEGIADPISPIPNKCLQAS